jgi:signal transduction histidine kinase
VTPRFRSVGARLSLALALVVAVALGIVYLSVVPSLKGRLEHTRLAQLESSAEHLKAQAVSSAPLFQGLADTNSRDIGARVAVFAATSVPGGSSVGGPIADSSNASVELTDDPVATRALNRGRLARGIVGHGDDKFAEAAVPFMNGSYVLLLRDSLQSQLASVQHVQRRLLLAAGVALLVALLLGYGGAWMFARRIRRLERAADRIAGGRFDEPVRDSGGDELGDLAAAFERMRIRLAQLDDARREFVANASHELRTPLFSLSGFLELMGDEELDEPTRLEFLESMREQVRRLTKLASDLLDLTRIDAGRLTVAREAVDVAGLAEDLVAEFGPAAQANEHELRLEPDGAAVADADELRVLQIGRILVENALLHTPPGTGVQVRAVTRNGRVLLEVQDEGPGIAPDHQEQLFERFFRLDGTRASGSGLGLAIAKQFAELMHGAVVLESDPGRTVFSLELPPADAKRAPFSRETPVGAAASLQ